MSSYNRHYSIKEKFVNALIKKIFVALWKGYIGT